MAIRIIEPAARSATGGRVKTLEPAPKPASVKAREDARKRVRNSQPAQVRAFTQGATLGFSDEIDAAGAALETGANNLLRRMTGRESVGYGMRDAYDAVMAEEKEANAEFAREHPVQNILLQIGGGVATPGAAAAGRFVGGARGLGGAVARSALVGAGYGGVAGAGASDGSLENRAKGAGRGAAVGGVVGAATPVVARAASRVGNALRPAVDEEAGMREAAEALQESGIDVRTISRATMDRIRAQVRQGRDAREAALGVVANHELPVALPMTRGQRSGDPGQQLSENLMLRGARGSAAARQMRGLVGEQQEALRGNVEAIGNVLSGGAPSTRGYGGEVVSDRLNVLRDAASRGVDEAYNAARAAAPDARLPPHESFTVASRLREAVSPYATERTAGGVFDEINALGQTRGTSMQDLQAARTRLVALQGSSDGPVRTAAGRAKAALDSYIDEAVERGIIQGDAASAWSSAISSRRDFGRQFEAGDLVDKLTARSSDGTTRLVEPNSAANEILTRSDMGFVGRKNLYRDLGKVRTMLGADSPEWNALRGEVFQRVASQGEGGVEFGQRQFSGVKFQKAWQDFQRKDPNLASSLFTADERAQIDRFAVLAARVTSPVKGGDNPSNTAVSAMRLLGNLRFLRGLPFVREITTEIEAQINLGAARSATTETISRAAQRLRPNPAQSGVNVLFSTAARTPAMIGGRTQGQREPVAEAYLVDDPEVYGAAYR